MKKKLYYYQIKEWLDTYFMFNEDLSKEHYKEIKEKVKRRFM